MKGGDGFDENETNDDILKSLPLEYKEKMKKVTDGNITKFVCQLCDIEYKQEINARSHIESKHFGM